MSVVQSILRFFRKYGALPHLSGNLLENPCLEHNFPRSSSAVDIPSAFGNTILYAPGWYDFGAYDNGRIQAPEGLSLYDMSTDAHGVKILQYQDKVKGLCQAVFRAKQLRGRKVRISGRYRINNADGSGVTGISVWLKGDPRKILTSDWQSVNVGGGNPSPRTNVLGLGGAADVGHIIRMTNNTGSDVYGDGEELFNRVFDWWDVGPKGTVGAGEGLIEIGGPSGEEGCEQCDDGGAGFPQPMSVWYLDDAFVDDPTSGTEMRLHSETQVGTGAHSFEAFIDVPDNGSLFAEGDVWLCVFPCDPVTGVGSMGGTAEITLQSISLQVVLDGEGGEDIIEGTLTPSSGLQYGFGGRARRYMMQYPIYVPCNVPMSEIPSIAQGSTPDADSVDYTAVYYSSAIGDGISYIWFDRTAGQTTIQTTAQQHVLPPASVVTRAAFAYDIDINPGIMEMRLRQRLSYTPGNGIDPWDHNMEIVDLSRSIDAVAYTGTDNHQAERAYRNKIGQFWPHWPATAQTIEADGKLASAIPEMTIRLPVGADFKIKGLYMEVFIDPRLHHFMWTRW